MATTDDRAALPDRAELRLLERVYVTTDCCNRVYDWAGGGSGFQRRVALRCVTKGWVIEHPNALPLADGDGFTVHPERYATCYQLTLSGYQALTRYQPEGYPESHRRHDLLDLQAKGKAYD